MLIPHWAIGLAIFAGLAAFIGFAFRQGLQVKPDRNKDPNDWSQYGARRQTLIRRRTAAAISVRRPAASALQYPKPDRDLRLMPIRQYSR
jgi:hypothetical protein